MMLSKSRPLSAFVVAAFGCSFAGKEAKSEPSKAVDGIVQTIGETPLVELKSLSLLTKCRIYAKVEFMNPSGSVKDRAAKYIIDAAEKNGQLQPGWTIVEGTGGNTGVGLALLAAAKGYKAIFTMPDSTSKEKIELMEVLGAEVHVQPGTTFEDPQHYYHLARSIGNSTPNSFFCNQFENIANMLAHYEGTGPEIWTQLNGEIDGFVTSSGTGGTIAGCSKYLKEQNPDITVWLVDPEGGATSQYVNSNMSNSTIKNGYEFIPRTEGSTIAEGIGLDRVTKNFKEAKIDYGIFCTNQEIVDMAYFLLYHDGIFVGPSAAANAVGAVKLARHLGPGKVIVTILCDGGDRYRSKLYNQEWLTKHNISFSKDNNSINFVNKV